MPTLYIRGKKYSGSTWYDMKIATDVEDSVESVPSSSVLYQVKENLDEKIQSYPNLSSFPTTGMENTLYIDLETNKTYRWDDTNVKYYAIGTDYNDIEIIDGSF